MGNFQWFLKMICGNYGEVSDKWQYLGLMDTVALKGSRGGTSMVCKLCTRKKTPLRLSSTIKLYNVQDNKKFEMIAEFESWGLEPMDFKPPASYVAEGVESGTTFRDTNLQEKA